MFSMGNKKPETKVRSLEVDAEIISLLMSQTPVFQISRMIPIGEKIVRKIMKENNIVFPKKVNKVKLERKARREAKHLERETKKKQNASKADPISIDMRHDDAHSMVCDIPWSYA